MTKPKIGLLPLYIELYDRALPEVRPRIDAFSSTIAFQLEKRGMDVVTAPVCRLEPEFAAAVSSFEQAACDAIVTLHLAYSPSLESARVLAQTKLPLIVLDTTPTYSYGPAQDPTELMFNHGIHGVQDMCNVLIRNSKRFQIEAGHWEKSDVLDRVAGWARGAAVAAAMRRARVGIIGSPFKGMGDFAVPTDDLRSTIGVETIACDPAVIRALVPEPDAPEVREEIDSDPNSFLSNGLDMEKRRETARACLAVRRWLAQENLSAFTMNFLETDKSSGLPTVPFLEASKAMSRGVGYAGEGDVLTAALVGALLSAFPDTTFTEMFCPDWAGNSIFLNHMGEMNVNLAVGKPLLRVMDFPWTDADDPVFAVGRFRGGEAVLVNLAPGPDNLSRGNGLARPTDRASSKSVPAGGRVSYTLVVAPVEMLYIKGKDNMGTLIHGWFRPEIPIAQFLEEYSRAGGTHHLALVYGDIADDIMRFGEIMGWRTSYLGKSGVL
ncbi:MAG: hypothetical protein Q7T82_10130 [Armatimonadota bacterium]|nr:hypothetical protein [Armatimonadota bacterium]